MRTLDIRKACPTLADTVQQLDGEPVVLVKGRKPIAVIMPVEDTDLEAVSLSLNPKFMQMLERSRRSLYEKGGIPHDEVCRMFGIEPPKIATRQPRRRKRKAN